MQYKTIMLEMLKQRPVLYEQLRSQRTLKATMENYASELRNCHLEWEEQLSQAKPESSESQIASEALEIALQEMEQVLPPVSAPDEDETETLLDQAMAFILHPTLAE